MTNPLLQPAIQHFELDFNSIQEAHFVEALDALIPAMQTEHEALATKAGLTYAELFEGSPNSRQLGAVMGLLTHLGMVAETPELRRIETEYAPRIAQLAQEQGLDSRVYWKIKNFAATPQFEQLTELQRRAVTKTLRNYERSGIQLPDAQKARIAEISARMSELSQKFSTNLTDFTDQAVLTFSKEELVGLPARTLANLGGTSDGKLQVGMVDGSFTDVMTYCEVASTRKAVYEAMLGRGTQAPWDNRPLLGELAALPQERAALQGYPSHAHYALEDRMAGNPAAALQFEEELAKLSWPKAKAEADELAAFGAQLLGRPPEFHDRAFISEKRRQAAYATNAETIRQYFPVKIVVAGLIRILEELYGLRFERIDVSTWHEDVVAYAMYDVTTQASLGRVYMDLFKRKSKQSGAWMNPMCNRHIDANGVRQPVTYLVCNAPKDIGQEPTFEFGEIVTLFHEMGHTLHNQLTEIDEEYFSGLGQVQHDAVELPSQFLENFCWDYEIVKQLSAHVTTGECLPASEFQNLVAARYFQAAESMLGGARLSMMDMTVFSVPGTDPLTVEDEVSRRWAVRPRDTRALIMPLFGHIFGGGYAAGYYAYQWAEMLSADAFAALKEEGASYRDQAAAVKRFRKHILAAGGVSDMGRNFQAFRGRAPRTEFLLASYGISVPEKVPATVA